MVISSLLQSCTLSHNIYLVSSISTVVIASWPGLSACLYSIYCGPSIQPPMSTYPSFDDSNGASAALSLYGHDGSCPRCVLRCCPLLVVPHLQTDYEGEYVALWPHSRY